MPPGTLQMMSSAGQANTSAPCSPATINPDGSINLSLGNCDDGGATGSTAGGPSADQSTTPPASSSNGWIVALLLGVAVYFMVR